VVERTPLHPAAARVVPAQGSADLGTPDLEDPEPDPLPRPRPRSRPRP
jgi:hypothetical protein